MTGGLSIVQVYVTAQSVWFPQSSVAVRVKVWLRLQPIAVISLGSQLGVMLPSQLSDAPTKASASLQVGRFCGLQPNSMALSGQSLKVGALWSSFQL